MTQHDTKTVQRKPNPTARALGEALGNLAALVIRGSLALVALSVFTLIVAIFLGSLYGFYLLATSFG